MTLRLGHVEFGGWIIHIQAGVDSDPLGYDQPTATYDGAVTYDAPSATRSWTTIDCQVTRVTCNHGGSLSQTPGVVARLGRLTATLYDPNRLLDPASTPYELLMKPGAPVRVIAVQPVTGAIFPIWNGIAETFDHNLKTGEGSLVASDLVALFTGVDMTAWDRPIESSVARLASVVAVMPNPIPLVFSGTATTLVAAKFSGSLWSSVVENTGHAEQSIIWVDPYGRLRRSETQGLGPPVTVTDCDDGTTPLIYYELTSTVDDDLLANLVRVERTNLPDNVDRVPLQYSNATSVTRNGPHSLTNLSLPLVDDVALRDWALRVLDLRSTPTPGLTGLQIMLTDTFPWITRSIPTIVRLDVGSVLDVTLSSRGEPGHWVVAVAGISHTISPHEWAVDIDVIDGPRLTENWGYNHVQSVYDTTLYAARPGMVGPSAAQIEAALVRVLSEEAMV